MEKDARKPQARSAAPPKVTAQFLENSALHYLERFAASTATLRRVLMRKVARSAASHGTDEAEGAGLVEALIARYVASGLLDDRAYAARQAASLARRGASRYGISGKLAQKGIGGELIAGALSELAEEGGSELASACALVRRRRLGPYRPAEKRAEAHRRDLATLARAGFRMDVARRVLAAADVEALDTLARGEEE